MNRVDRCVGSIVGLAVGDALGYPHEFRTVAQVRRELGPDGVVGFLRLKDPRFTRPFIVGTDHPPGTFTDDTQMSLALAEALLEARTADVDVLMPIVAKRFVDWYFADDNDRSPGEATGIGCTALRDGAPWRTAGVAHSKGCGANMRVAPIGLYFDDLDVVAHVARAQSLLTHRHPAALEGAAAAALCVALALRGADPPAMHAEVARRCVGRDADFDAVWTKIPRVLDEPAERVLVDPAKSAAALGEGWVAEEAIAAALWCVWRWPDDYRAGVLQAVNTDGDSDSLACIAGSILGARLGIDAIPAEWARDIEQSAYLHDVGRRLGRSVSP